MDWGEREAEAGAVLRECRAVLAARRTTLIREMLGMEPGEPADWRHYPDGEVYDPASHAQYFFHRHGGAGSGEHGHIHLFLRGEGIPPGMTPLLLPEAAVANAPQQRHSAPLKRGSRDEVCHIVAIALDDRGDPVRLFTTNRWVTGETWYRADDVIGMLDRVRFGAGAAPALVSRWIAALVRLFRPELGALLRNRDKRVMEWRWRWPRGSVFEDSRLEETSSLAIDLDARLAAVEAPVTALPRRAAQPSSMAEGWGG